MENNKKEAKKIVYKIYLKFPNIFILTKINHISALGKIDCLFFPILHYFSELRNIVMIVAEFEIDIGKSFLGAIYSNGYH